MRVKMSKQPPPAPTARAVGPPYLRKNTKPFIRFGMYPSISKCNAKRCKCCKHLSTLTTVTSSVNGRPFSVINNSDLD